MNLARIYAMLDRDEGRLATAYRDQFGNWTIGVGHKLTPGNWTGLTWSDGAIDATLADDVRNAQALLLAHLPWTSNLDEARYAVLLNMVFQMGIYGVLEFNHTLAAVETSQWKAAHDGMLASKWASQTPNRAQRLATQMLTGQWQYPEPQSTTGDPNVDAPV